MTWHEMVGAEWFRWSGPNRGIVLGVWWNVALLVLSVAALPFDRRTILGLNPWIKPIKFELSVIVFLLTMAALLGALGRLGAWPQTRTWLAWAFGVAMLIENTLIAMQALRGVRSHMNFTTTFNSLTFAAMGIFVIVNTLALAVLLLLYLRAETGLPQVLSWSIVLGLLLLFAGSIEGTLMVSKYAAHTVGAADGGPGLPFVNWSTGHGDLRVAHFFALHALQAFLLVGWLLSRAPIEGWMQTAAVVVFALVYSGFVWFLFQQAIRGEPLLARWG